MKCGMLMSVAIHACAPAPISTRSDRPLSSSGTNTISDSPPTQQEVDDGREERGGPSASAQRKRLQDRLLQFDGGWRCTRRLCGSALCSFTSTAPPLAEKPNSVGRRPVPGSAPPPPSAGRIDRSAPSPMSRFRSTNSGEWRHRGISERPDARASLEKVRSHVANDMIEVQVLVGGCHDFFPRDYVPLAPLRYATSGSPGAATNRRWVTAYEARRVDIRGPDWPK